LPSVPLARDWVELIRKNYYEQDENPRQRFGVAVCEHESELYRCCSFQNLFQRIGHDFVKANQENYEHGSANQPKFGNAKDFIGITARSWFRHTRPL
jgi:hypothetical protein